MLHHLNADVTGIFVGEQRVGVINHSRNDAAQNGKTEFGADQPPQSRRYGAGRVEDPLENVNNQLRNVTEGDGKKRGDDASDNTESDDTGPRVPDDLQDRRDIAQG